MNDPRFERMREMEAQLKMAVGTLLTSLHTVRICHRIEGLDDAAKNAVDSARGRIKRIREVLAELESLATPDPL